MLDKSLKQDWIYRAHRILTDYERHDETVAPGDREAVFENQARQFLKRGPAAMRHLLMIIEEIDPDKHPLADIMAKDNARR